MPAAPTPLREDQARLLQALVDVLVAAGLYPEERTCLGSSTLQPTPPVSPQWGNLVHNALQGSDMSPHKGMCRLLRALSTPMQRFYVGGGAVCPWGVKAPHLTRSGVPEQQWRLLQERVCSLKDLGGAVIDSGGRVNGLSATMLRVLEVHGGDLGAVLERTLRTVLERAATEHPNELWWLCESLLPSVVAEVELGM
jgi:hypothetical protein